MSWSTYEPTTTKQSYRTARKNHKCFVCKGKIIPKDTYRESTIFWADKFHTIRICPECIAKEEEYEQSTTP